MEQYTPDIEISVHTEDAMNYYEELTMALYDWWPEHTYSTKLGIPFKPTRSFFELAAQHKSLIVVILRQKETKVLAGAYIGVLQKFLHNQDVSMCSELVWFLDKKFQNKKISGALLGAVEKVLSLSGIEIMTCSIAHLESEPEEVTQKKIAAMGRIGYNKTDTVFYKRLL